MEHKTPKLDKLILFLLEKKANNEISHGAVAELKQLLIEQSHEMYNTMDHIYETEVKTRTRWIGFILGVISTIVVSGVGLAIYFDYFK